MGEKRCTGHCCKAFYLPYSPEEMRARLDEDRKRERDDNLIPNTQGLWDGEQIYAMIIHLGEFTVKEVAERYQIGIITDSEEQSNQKGHYYTCKHYVDGNCQIYETRPRMCSGYPYGKACRYAGCTAPEKGAIYDYPSNKVHLPVVDDAIKIKVRHVAYNDLKEMIAEEKRNGRLGDDEEEAEEASKEGSTKARSRTDSRHVSEESSESEESQEL